MQLLNFTQALTKTLIEFRFQDFKNFNQKFNKKFNNHYQNIKYLNAKRAMFKSENEILDSIKHYKSPSQKYQLTTSRFGTGKNTWSYSQGKVYLSNSNNPIAIVQRNYSSFPFSFIENHPNGHDYLICGEDYQGQTLIELDTGKKINYLPNAAKKGAGFCWAKITPSPNGLLLAVEGCYWGAPCEIIIVDFSEPMSPPFPILSTVEYEEFFSWINNQSAKLGRSYEWSKRYNKSETDCTLEELGIIESNNKYDEEWELRREEVIWQKPTLLESTKQQLKEWFLWRRDRNIPPSKDLVIITGKLINKLTKQEKENLFSDFTLKTLWEWAQAKAV